MTGSPRRNETNSAALYCAVRRESNRNGGTTSFSGFFVTRNLHGKSPGNEVGRGNGASKGYRDFQGAFTIPPPPPSYRMTENKSKIFKICLPVIVDQSVCIHLLLKPRVTHHHFISAK